MSEIKYDRKVVRCSFGKMKEIAEIPNLIGVQRRSYGDFLQLNTTKSKRADSGLQGVFKSVFPITDVAGQVELRFLGYALEPPKHDVLECLKGGLTYASSLKASLALVIWDANEETGGRKLRVSKEQDVYMGTVPLMTDDGSFIISGTRRVIVSQMHRSPGVFYDHDKGKTHYSGKHLYGARIIPYRGSWLDFEFDIKDLMYLRIDRKRKLLASTLLLALPKGDPRKAESRTSKLTEGMSRSEIVFKFHKTIKWKRRKQGWVTGFVADHYLGTRPRSDIADAKTGQVLFAKAKEVNKEVLAAAVAQKPSGVLIAAEGMVGRYIGEDITVGEQEQLRVGQVIGSDVLAYLEDREGLRTLLVGGNGSGPYLLDTLAADKNQTREDALYEIYRVVRAGETPSAAAAEDLLYGLFFDSERYDLSPVGRVKLNERLGLSCPIGIQVLRKEDIFAVVKTFMDVKESKNGEEVDDIDNLGNRRVRSVGEVMENQYRIGLTRMARVMKERIGSQDVARLQPNDLVNAKAITSIIREFFGSSRLSQFMDQTNPLSEITHKRRLSALGPGGLTRERAGFDVRDVHPSHYGRICPIETPEGPNIGLINSLAIFARVNPYGFIETPYRKVVNGRLSDEIVYLSAAEERRCNIAMAGADIDDKGGIRGPSVQCHRGGESLFCAPEEVEYADVSPRQLVSVAAALIPFLENDDANRALMGSNMQRQAVPLLFPRAPLVGTGMETLVARDSATALFAERDGVVEQVDAARIVIRHDDSGGRASNGRNGKGRAVKIYHLIKFQRSNQDTCVNQRPVVEHGDRVKAGDIIADGSSTERGELALGRNLTVAFMLWRGYNFEDSILISDRVVQDDVFTSLHIQEFESTARDTKLGPEEITRDIPNAQEEQLRHLDEVGIVRVGAEVSAGDILVGKVTPKGESVMTPEEKLLCAIFGEKASDVKDISLIVPPGISGTVIEVRVFSRKGVDKDERAMISDEQEIDKLRKDHEDECKIYESGYAKQFRQVLLDEKAVSGPGVGRGQVLTAELLDSLEPSSWKKLNIADPIKMKQIRRLRQEIAADFKDMDEKLRQKIARVRENDELPPGVLKMVKVFVTVKRKLQTGDKMAGRHGNKGVVSKIVPMEDMPYTEDGTPVDIVLNPLGVPSRMNVGQIMETHLGRAARLFGNKLDKMLRRLRRDKTKIEEMRALLGKLYKGGIGGKSVKKLSGARVLSLAKNLRNGAILAAPVFEAATLEEIENTLAAVGCETSGATRLYDGCSGAPFARDVIVGIIYMLKLHHLVDDKIHARSTGPYSLVTQQPLGGKAQFGGQRFGEMEVWSLEAYGAAYVLQEMLTIKSDDIAGRSRAYEAIIRGDNSFESGIPESFNVLTVEMRALGLNAKLTTSGDGEVPANIEMVPKRLAGVTITPPPPSPIEAFAAPKAAKAAESVGAAQAITPPSAEAGEEKGDAPEGNE